MLEDSNYRDQLYTKLLRRRSLCRNENLLSQVVQTTINHSIYIKEEALEC
jgi:hypothetical protein